MSEGYKDTHLYPIRNTPISLPIVLNFKHSIMFQCLDGWGGTNEGEGEERWRRDGIS